MPSRVAEKGEGRFDDIDFCRRSEVGSCDGTGDEDKRYKLEPELRWVYISGSGLSSSCGTGTERRS